MGTSNLFIQDGIDMLSLFKYMDRHYNSVTLHDNGNDVDFGKSYIIRFLDFEDYRELHIDTYTDANEKDVPAPVKPNKSVRLSLGFWGRATDILNEIADNFGGGYIWERCDVSDNPESSDIAKVAEKLYAIFKKDKRDYKIPMDFNDAVMMDFILRHLNEIKEL